MLKALRAETERALLVTGIALRRYHLRHGQFPATLETLVPEFLDAVPLDRMDGQPLHGLTAGFARGYIGRGATLGDFRDIVLDRRAAEDGQRRISPQIRFDGGSGE
jgi:hypothetical protein